MRNNLVLGAAIAAVLVGVSAGATEKSKSHPAANTSIDIYASGSSALGKFFVSDLQSALCGNAGVATATYLDGAYTAYEPSFSAYQCTNATASTTYTLHYSAELGSTWGIYEAINPGSTRQYLTPNAAGCASGSYSVAGAGTKTGASWPTPGATSYCLATGYNHVYDYVANDPNSIMTQSAADIVLSDVEPDLFNGANWPSTNHDTTLRPAILGSAPSPTNLTVAAGIMTAVQGQIFQVIAHGIPGSTDGTGQPATPFNISTQSLRAILTGKYTKWSQVPEVGANDTATGGTPINICRRDHGSGTEIGADVTFVGATCNATNWSNTLANVGSIKTGNQTTYGTSVVPFVYEAPASADMKACVASAPGTIGFLSNTTKDSNFSYQILTVDGYYPSAHNAAAGLYHYAYEAQMGLTGNSSSGQGAAQTLVADAASWNVLETEGFAKEAGTYTEGGAGGFVPSTIGNVTLYTIPGGTDGGSGGVSGTGATAMTSGIVAEGLFSRNGNSCALPNNSNQ